MRSTLMTLAAAIILGGALAAGAEQAGPDPGAAMKAGKAAFEQNCRLCHGLDRALAKRDTLDGWTQTVKRMVLYGAPLNAEQRGQVSRYLAAQSAFARACSGCHAPTKAVGDGPGRRDWKALLVRMEGHLKDLEKKGKAPKGVTLAPQEIEDIAAFLGVVVPD